jgi:heme exporter protein C
MFKYLKPNNLLKIINKTQKFVFVIFLVIISIGLVEALLLSPEDYKQSDSVRIMYVHVPAAWISLGIFSLIAVLSFGILVFKNKNLSLITKSLAPSGFVFNVIALVTGSIWGKPTWGTWWAWDARITSMLLLAFFYLMFLLSWRVTDNEEKAVKISSYIAIIGLINVPIIKFSVEWWSTFFSKYFYRNFHSCFHAVTFRYNDCGICTFFAFDIFDEI